MNLRVYFPLFPPSHSNSISKQMGCSLNSFSSFDFTHVSIWSKNHTGQKFPLLNYKFWAAKSMYLNRRRNATLSHTSHTCVWYHVTNCSCPVKFLPHITSWWMDVNIDGRKTIFKMRCTTLRPAWEETLWILWSDTSYS